MLLHKQIFYAAQRLRLVSTRLRMENSPDAKGFDMAYMIIIRVFKKSMDLNLHLRNIELEREIAYLQSNKLFQAREYGKLDQKCKRLEEINNMLLDTLNNQ